MWVTKVFVNDHYYSSVSVRAMQTVTLYSTGALEQGTGRPGVGPWAPYCGCPLILVLLGMVQCS